MAGAKGKGRKPKAAAPVIEESSEEEQDTKMEEEAKVATTTTAKGKKKTKKEIVKEEREREEEEEEANRTRDEEKAGALEALDVAQYYPVLLDFDEGTAPASSMAEKLRDQGHRVDMCGETALESAPRRFEDDNLANFVKSDGKDFIENGDGFVLFQFPTELPDLPPVPEGKEGLPRKVGKLRWYTDGKAEIDIGGVVLDVNPGTLSECRHDIAILSTIENECKLLGSVVNKQVCTPSLKDI